MKKNSICINDVIFRKISELCFDKKVLSDLQFFIISQSGIIDTPGNIYFFTNTGAFFMDECENKFIDKLLLKFADWNLINLCFCDFLIINPKIYKCFVQELCAKNIRDYWFYTAIDIYKDKLSKKSFSQT